MTGASTVWLTCLPTMSSLMIHWDLRTLLARALEMKVAFVHYVSVCMCVLQG